MTLSQQQGQLSAFISTWTETATASGATATATHTDEAGLSHYVTGFSATTYDSMSGAGTTTIVLKDGTGAIMTFYADNGIAGDGNGITHSFTSPIKITAGAKCSLEITSGSSGDTVVANLWGFTSL